MSDINKKIDELALLMQEYQLVNVEFSSEEFSIRFSKQTVNHHHSSAQVSQITIPTEQNIPAITTPEVPQGTPITSPLTGVFYTTPDPSSPAFIKEGDTVSQGQVIGLVEAMKVFNEITAPQSGIVSKYYAENGNLVQLGETLLYIR